MPVKYGKPLGDVAEESRRRLEQDADILTIQETTRRVLDQAPRRTRCGVCRASLEGAPAYLHRGTRFVICECCGQLMTAASPPEGYPQKFCPQASFATVYPPLDQEAFISRRDRIYRPKIDWALQCLMEAGLSRSRLTQARWLELGAGAGYFISCLQELGIQSASGVEADPVLVERAQKLVGPDLVRHHGGDLSQAVRGHQADVYVAWFVLEHENDLAGFFDTLSLLPSGTIFLFSVPTISMATLLEACFDGYSARHLDAVIHTQLFSDQSIAYCLDKAGFKELGRWVFGSDALDLGRLLAMQVKDRGLEPLERVLSSGLATCWDGIQEQIDRSLLADSRHVAAVKI